MTVRYDVRLSRAEGYRKLGMYADACWELEELEGDDRLSDPVLVCRWKIYRDSENLLGEKAMAAEMARRFPADWEWRLRTARAVRRYEDAETALAYLNEKAEAFCGYPAYLYEIGRCKCLTGDLKGARDAVRDAIKLDAEYRAKFVEDEDFDAVWDSFGEK